MAQTASIERISTSPDRNRLRTALTNFQAEQQRLQTLQDARERAREQSWEIASLLRDAEAKLRRAKADEPHRLAYAFAQGHPRDGITPVEVAQANRDRVQAEHSGNEQVAAALDNEILAVTNRVQRAQNQVYVALAEIVCPSPEYQALVEQHRNAWKRLRTVKETLRVVRSALQGNMPTLLHEEADLSEPLEIRVGFGVDETLVNAWSEAMAQLEIDADAPLPSQV